MKKSSKAALWSALVFPGLGHFLVRRYATGLVLLCLSGWSLYSITTTVVDSAVALTGDIQGGSMAIETGAIGEVVLQRAQQAEQSAHIPMMVLTLCWVIGIADAYRVGRSQERAEEASARRQGRA